MHISLEKKLFKERFQENMKKDDLETIVSVGLQLREFADKKQYQFIEYLFKEVDYSTTSKRMVCVLLLSTEHRRQQLPSWELTYTEAVNFFDSSIEFDKIINGK